MLVLSRLPALLVRAGIGTVLSVCASTSALAADAWPTKPIRMIVGFAAGSSPDVQARLLAEPLSKALGQPVVVENKPGASGNIGADAIAKAEDGHTIGIIGNGPLTSSKYLYSKLPYDPDKDFAPLALVGAAPLVWVIAKNPATANAGQFLKYARAEGDKISYGSVGAGSGTHLGAELLKSALNINPVHVPYGGGPAVLTALAAGQIQMALIPGSTAAPMIQAGKIEAIAATSSKKSPLAPGLPGMEDLGAPNVNIEVWNAVMAPAKMPKADQEKLSAILKDIIESPEIRQKLLAQGWRVDDPSPAALTKRMQADARNYEAVIRKNNIKLD